MNDEYYDNIQESLKSMIRRYRALRDTKKLESYERTLKEFEQQMLDDCEYVKHDPAEYIRSCKL